VIRQGPIPAWLHGILEYVEVVVLIVGPFVLDFRAGAATGASIVIGVVLLFVVATTVGSTGLVSQVPIPVHVLLDYILAGVLVACPFIFGFSNETNPTAFFIALGIVHLLVTIATRFLPARAPEAPSPEKPRPA
jgi:asparagine N-glycosylation enzyme membrane subunit Stt3